jgi:hypothetical protein
VRREKNPPRPCRRGPQCRNRDEAARSLPYLAGTDPQQDARDVCQATPPRGLGSCYLRSEQELVSAHADAPGVAKAPTACSEGGWDQRPGNEQRERRQSRVRAEVQNRGNIVADGALMG